MAHYEFLPLCDVLFNIISLASYFCDVVFDVVMGYALFERGLHVWFAVTLTFVTSSLVISQVLSFKWYLRSCAARKKTKEKWKTEEAISLNDNQVVCWLVAGLHIFQCGVLWRYFKLFIPVDLRFVKHEVRDLCMLRLLHAFCEAAPMLLLQLYLLFQEPSTKEFSDLNLVSTLLSLFSVCWALASFSKNVRLQNVHRLVLTWLGVVTQFFWRLGTVSSRVIALTVYATLYGHWVFIVIGLHWVSMFLWLISPKNVFHGERISKQRKAAFSGLIAVVYIFAYINLQEVNPRQKMTTFYVVMFLENALLVTVWLVGVWVDPPWYLLAVPVAVFASFAAGVAFMALYYRFFHVRRLRYEAGGRPTSYDKCDSTQRLAPAPTEPSAKDELPAHIKSGVITEVAYKGKQLQQQLAPNVFHPRLNGCAPYRHNGIPGVFNCRFASPAASGGVVANATKRKKKKPTSFVPPPVVVAAAPSLGGVPFTGGGGGQNSVPFWRRPLPGQHNHHGGSSENDGSSVGSRVNIQQKLAEKKQKQLAELRVIEEEIKQGKIPRPGANSNAGPAPGGGGALAAGGGGGGDGSLPRQPIPRSKRHVDTTRPPPYAAYHMLPPPRAKHRANTPEILLAPHYLESTSLYYGWEHERAPAYRLADENRDCSSDHDSTYADLKGGGDPTAAPSAADPGGGGGGGGPAMYKSYRIPSDMDSQVSIPRSYTLPREFKYCRRPKSRKAIRSEHFVVASTNSSDGDVDSGDETTHPDQGQPSQRAVRSRPYRGYARRDHHETKL